MLSLYCSECTVNLHENFISILGDSACSEWIPHRCKFFGLASLSFFFRDTGLKGWICLLCLENAALRLTCHIFQTACPAVESKEQFCRQLWLVLGVRSRQRMGESSHFFDHPFSGNYSKHSIAEYKPALRIGKLKKPGHCVKMSICVSVFSLNWKT